jgi:hypothetical protein
MVGGKDLGGSGHVKIEVLLWRLLGETEKNRGKTQSKRQMYQSRFELRTSKYRSRKLLLDQLARSLLT